MLSILSLLLVILVSMLIVKVAAVALTLTGLSAESASFQARSAFSGSGFTTQESESVVNHPVRRRIVMLLMLLGNAGIVTAVTTLLLSFSGPTQTKQSVFDEQWFHLLLLLFGLYLLWRISCSQWFDRRLTHAIEWSLRHWTQMDVRDYIALFRLQGEYSISEIAVKQDDWLVGNTLIELRLNHEGVLVLGIERHDGTYIGAPRGQTLLEPGDVLLIYGRESVLEDIDQRKQDLEGYTAFVRSCKQQSALEQQEETNGELVDNNLIPAGQQAQTDPLATVDKENPS